MRLDNTLASYSVGALREQLANLTVAGAHGAPSQSKDDEALRELAEAMSDLKQADAPAAAAEGKLMCHFPYNIEEKKERIIWDETNCHLKGGNAVYGALS